MKTNSRQSSSPTAKQAGKLAAIHIENTTSTKYHHYGANGNADDDDDDDDDNDYNDDDNNNDDIVDDDNRNYYDGLIFCLRTEILCWLMPILRLHNDRSSFRFSGYVII
uniref:Uncharacterized protein n=1 Tax=Glossina pallidipes TaxID=7398 RepID=A0A1A9ZLW2_GLOPL